jgi:hypothetical protein
MRAGSVVAVAAAGQVELPDGEVDALLGEEEEDEEGGLFDLKKLQTSLTENINRCGTAAGAMHCLQGRLCIQLFRPASLIT